MKMPRRVEKAKIALLACPIQVQKTKYDAKVTITEPEQMTVFMNTEDEMLRNLVDKIVSSGARVVVNQKFVDELAGYYFARQGILAVRWESEYDMECLRKATGGKLVKDIDDLTPEDLGYAGLVEERKVGGVKWIFFEECRKPKSLTILIRGPTPEILDMSLFSMGDALFAVRDVMRDPRVVAGGGAAEMEVAMRLRGWATKLSGREQLAALSFAEALEAIPLKIAENAGLDALDVLVALRARHKKGEVWAGIDAFDGKVKDMMGISVVDPVSVKEQMLKSACEAAGMVLRIDDMIAVRRQG